jgi:type IV secretion system pilin
MSQKTKIKLNQVVLITLTSLFLFLLITTSASAIELHLQRPFGDLKETIEVSGSSIGEYIKAAYGFGSATVVALAIVMIIVGGVQWVISGGSPDTIGKAKDTIFKAFLGLFIALFSVFMLTIVNPGAVTFNPITPTEIVGTECCKIGEELHLLGGADCRSKKGEVVAPDICVAGFDSDESDECNARNPRASCFTGSCESVGRITNQGICRDPGKPNCCAETGPVAECKNASMCNADQYCASAGADQPGRCFDKRSNGMNCMEIILGSTSGDLLGGGPDEICISDVCEGYTSGGIGKCVPKDGTGLNKEYCSDKNQCISKHCYSAKNGGNEGHCYGTSKETAGLNSGQLCQNANVDSGGLNDDSPCKNPADGNIFDNCPGKTGVVDDCK